MFFRGPILPFFGAMEELMGLALIGLLTWFVIWVIRERGCARRDRAEAAANEDEVLNRLARQLERMERRMENLETLLDKDQERERERDGGRRES